MVACFFLYSCSNARALVTRQAVADLELTKGAEVFAVFKASAVHLIPNARM